MKKLLLVALLTPAVLWAQESDRDAVIETINSAYLEGICNEGDAAKIDAGFYPGFSIFSYNDQNDRISQFPIYYWKELAVQRAEDGSNKERGPVSFMFPLVDVTGNTAIAKVEYYVSDNLIYTDYLSLYKHEDGWKIVTKVYYKHPEE